MDEEKFVLKGSDYDYLHKIVNTYLSKMVKYLSNLLFLMMNQTVKYNEFNNMHTKIQISF